MNPPDGVHALLITNDGNVCLQQKTGTYALNPEHAGKISMFGGAMEEGESELETLTRELSEELALRVGDLPIERLGSYRKMTANGAEHDVFVYVVRNVDPDALLPNLDDIVEGAAKVIVGHPQLLLKDDRLTSVTRAALHDFLLLGPGKSYDAFRCHDIL